MRQGKRREFSWRLDGQTVDDIDDSVSGDGKNDSKERISDYVFSFLHLFIFTESGNKEESAPSQRDDANNSRIHDDLLRESGNAPRSSFFGKRKPSDLGLRKSVVGKNNRYRDESDEKGDRKEGSESDRRK